jgi:hypothetical protein
MSRFPSHRSVVVVTNGVGEGCASDLLHHGEGACLAKTP